MYVRLITGPTEEPVSLTEAKAQMRIEDARDDVFIADLITTARQYVETVATRRAMLPQTWELVLDGFPDTSDEKGRPYISLPKGDVQSVTSVKYDDAAGVEQTFASSNYVLSGVVGENDARVTLKTSSSWPTTSDEVDSVRIRFVAGYANLTALKERANQLRQAVLLLVSQMYEHRTPEVTGTIISKVEFSLDALVSPFRLHRF